MSQCQNNNDLMMVSMTILVFSMAITMVANGNHDNVIGNMVADGFNYLLSGEFYYIAHPMELLVSPWFWVVIGLVAIWKKWGIIYFFMGIVDHFRKKELINTSEMNG